MIAQSRLRTPIITVTIAIGVLIPGVRIAVDGPDQASIAFAFDDASAARLRACHAAALAPMIQRPRVALGSWYGPLSVTNTGTAPCLLPGYPVMRIEDAQARMIPTTNGMLPTR